MRIAPYATIWLIAVAAICGGASGDAREQAAPRPAPSAAAPSAPAPSAAASSVAARPVEGDAAFLTQYCLGCHNARAKVGGLTLDPASLEHIGSEAAIWEKVVKKVKTGMMPPSGARRPEREMLDAFAGSVERRLDLANPPGAHPDSPALHRLNRTEYANVIRDLLSLEVDSKALLPPDDSSEGFDNLAEALSVSPSLIQGYVGAALKISRRAVGDRTATPTQVTYSAPPGLAQDRHIDGLPLGTRGGIRFTHTFPLDAEYEVTLGGGPAAGTRVEVTLDGASVPLDTPRTFRRVITAGPHVIGVALVDRQRGAGVDDTFSDFRVNSEFRTAGGVSTVVINGPFKPTSPGDTPSRRQIFVCRPATAAEEVPCAKRIISTLARRAFRGAVAESDIATAMSFYQQGRKDGDFETGVQQALARILVAPKFLYRSEPEPAGAPAGKPYRISDIALASRLSFFIWSSIPDDQLLDIASKGLLRNPKTLEQQLRRMLADPKSAALIENFAGQWLYLRELASVQTEAKNFDENLRRAFRRETELLFETIVREDRSLVDLLDADYTFVDERLARHYGIPNVYGSHFRRVALDESSPRRGLLGQGSMLTVTSVATRTSPVMRGKWVLENLLGTPPPNPPAGVEVNLEPDPAAKGPTTLRQRLEQHRANPACASCHRLMDPMGFALENFDLVGTWRDTDATIPIDSTGQLADGTPLKGQADLRKALLSRSEPFMTTATEKLMTYALGRPVHAEDMPAVRQIVRRAGANGNRFSALVLGIVESPSFRMRLKR